MGYHIIKGYFKPDEDRQTIKEEMIEWSECMCRDYMPVEHGTFTPLLFIHPDGMCEIINPDRMNDELKQLSTIKGINEYFNKQYGPKQIQYSIKRIVNTLSKKNVTADQIHKLSMHFAKVRLGMDNVHKPINVVTDTYNDWNFLQYGVLNIDDGITNGSDGYDCNVDWEPENLFLLVVDVVE